MNSKLQALLLATLGFGALVYGVLSYLDLPVVYISITTGKCVRVEVPNAETRMGCDAVDKDLTTYDKVWIR